MLFKSRHQCPENILAGSHQNHDVIGRTALINQLSHIAGNAFRQHMFCLHACRLWWIGKGIVVLFLLCLFFLQIPHFNASSKSRRLVTGLMTQRLTVCHHTITNGVIGKNTIHRLQNHGRGAKRFMQPALCHIRLHLTITRLETLVRFFKNSRGCSLEAID